LEPNEPIPQGFKPVLLEVSHVAYMPGTSMIRRVFDRVGKFEERWQIISDIVWFARLRESNVVVGIIDDVLLTKRIHSANLAYITAWPVYKRELMQMVRESLYRRSPCAAIRLPVINPQGPRLRSVGDKQRKARSGGLGRMPPIADRRDRP